MWTMIQLKATSAPIFPVKYTAFRHASRGKPISASCITDDSSMSEAMGHNRIFWCKNVNSLLVLASPHPLSTCYPNKVLFFWWFNFVLLCFESSKYLAIWAEFVSDLNRNDVNYLDSPSTEKQFPNFIRGDLVYSQNHFNLSDHLKTFPIAVLLWLKSEEKRIIYRPKSLFFKSHRKLYQAFRKNICILYIPGQRKSALGKWRAQMLSRKDRICSVMVYI